MTSALTARIAAHRNLTGNKPPQMHQTFSIPYIYLIVLYQLALPAHLPSPLFHLSKADVPTSDSLLPISTAPPSPSLPQSVFSPPSTAPPNVMEPHNPAAPFAPPPPPPPISHTHTADATAIDSFHWHLARKVTSQAIDDFHDLGRHNEPTAIMFTMDAAAAVAAHEVGRSVVDIRRLNEFNTLGNRRFGGDWENEWDEVEDLKADSRARRAREALEMEWSAGGTGHVEEAPNGVQPVCLSTGLTSREGWRLTLSRELPLFQSRRTSFFSWRKISIGRRRIGRHAGFSTPLMLRFSTSGLLLLRLRYLVTSINRCPPQPDSRSHHDQHPLLLVTQPPHRATPSSTLSVR